MEGQEGVKGYLPVDDIIESGKSLISFWKESDDLSCWGIREKTLLSRAMYRNNDAHAPERAHS